MAESSKPNRLNLAAGGLGPRVSRNVAANLAGGSWVALVGVAFVPFYIRLMGIESYALVGIFVSLQAMLSMLDLGLSQTLSREMARLSISGRNAVLMADTVRTTESVYWCASAAVALVVFALSDFIANRWLNPDQLSRAALQEALWAIALVIGLRWPVALYAGALIGLQRQVLLNVTLVAFSTVQAAGALAVMWLIEPTARCFFLWQGAIALVQVVVLRSVVYGRIGSPARAKFSRVIAQNLWRFAAGMTGIALASMLLTQADKILLSKLLTLTEFGYYTFATSVAGALYALTSAVYAAYQPRLTAAAAESQGPRLAHIYHQGCQLMAVAIVPAGAMLAFFSNEILFIWTQDARIVVNASLLISLLVAGNVLHGLMHLPYGLQLAFGWTRLALVSNVMALLVLIPGIYFATLQWGGIGAAAAWIGLNLAYVTCGVYFMHRRLLKQEMGRWYRADVITPAAAVLVVAGAGRLLIPSGLASPWIELSLVLVSAASLGAAFACCRALRPAGFGVPASIQL